MIDHEKKIKAPWGSKPVLIKTKASGLHPHPGKVEPSVILPGDSEIGRVRQKNWEKAGERDPR
jgi:hypothetical protein